MIKTFLFSFLMLGLVTSLHAQTDGPAADYYDSGKVKFRGQYLGGKKVGEWLFYHESGKLQAEGSYYDGLKLGKWIIYHRNGSKKSEGDYKSNGEEAVKNGNWVFYHKNGAISQKGEYDMGRKIDIWYEYSDTGEELSRKDHGR